MPAIDVTNIHIGPGDLFIGGTAPTAGTDPNDPSAATASALVAATSGFAGVSTTGDYVGATNGPATLTYRPTFYGVVTEQAYADVVTTPTAEEATLTFTALETTYQNIATAIGQGVSAVVTGPPAANVIYVGSKAVLETQPVVLISRKRSGTGYKAACIYQGYSSEGSSVNWERRAESRLPMTIRALADLTRPIGDQLFQVVDYAANPS
jgi:hypothetical protein